MLKLSYPPIRTPISTHPKTGHRTLLKRTPASTKNLKIAIVAANNRDSATPIPPNKTHRMLCTIANKRPTMVSRSKLVSSRPVLCKKAKIIPKTQLILIRARKGNHNKNLTGKLGRI